MTNGSFEEIGANDFPIDWEPVGQTVEVSKDARSGRYSLRMLRTPETKTIETGLNRAWKAHSGQQGSMLSQLKGGIMFWYKAISASDDARLIICIIPMSERPLEDTGEPRTIFTVPRSHIGDGRWHIGAIKYDYTHNPKVKWVHVAARIVGRAGELLLDDVSYVEQLGVWAQVKEIAIEEDANAPGSKCTVKAKISNVGDASLQNGIAILELEKGLKVEGSTKQTIPMLPPDESTTIQWTVVGDRTTAGTFRVRVQWEKQEIDEALTYRPKLQLLALEPERFIVSPSEEITLRGWVKNEGYAFVTDLEARLDAQGLSILDGQTKRINRLAPKAQMPFTWRVRLDGMRKANAKATVIAKNDKGGQFETEILPTQPFPTLPAAPFFGVEVKSTYAVLGNERVRLILPKNPFGFGTAELQALKGAKWLSVSRMAYLSRVVSLSDKGDKWEHCFYANQVEPLRSGEFVGLRFRALERDIDGAQWNLIVEFRLKPKEPIIAVSYSLSCDRARKVLAFEGPMLYVGEGSFGKQKQEAIFPGLEWLVGDEISSSDLDIERDHPDRIRYVPHPHKITIPAICIYSQGVAIGLLWDALQKWDGKNDRPSAVFASPNYFEGRNCHLMGLFLPSVPNWVKENEREATKPYDWDSKTPIHLEAEILADGNASDALRAIDIWLSRKGVPKPLPYPRGSREMEITFSMRGYLEGLWIPETKQWWTTKRGHPLMSQPARPLNYLYDLWMGTILATDPKIKRLCEERLKEVADGGLPQADDFGFQVAGPLRVLLIGFLPRIASLLVSQWEGGEWRFDADRKDVGVFKGMDYHLLGPDNAVEVGTCARNAYEVLRFARITGDEVALRSGLKALKFMERFHVPRAAQVWEIPVHTPDILAAADAVDAYIEGYRATNNQHYLEQAVRWARAGLPFIYAWNVPEFPFMRYASIPVFGATWFKGSWFGRAVQWNGLRYAYAVWKLAQELKGKVKKPMDIYHDPATWEQIAEGITVSACYQQDAEGEDVALWPDAISIIDGRKVKWVFAPRMILKNLYAFIGRDEEPTTVTLGVDGMRVPISAGGIVEKASVEQKQLHTTVSFHKGQPGFVLVPCAIAPDKVTVNGRQIAKMSVPNELQKSEGWVYDTSAKLLCIRLLSDGRHEISVNPFVPTRVKILPDLRTEIRFTFDEDHEGWMPTHDVANMQAEGGQLKGRITGGDPYIVRPLLKVPPDAVKRIRIRMMVTKTGNGQFYWTTEASPNFGEDKVIRFQVAPDGQFHELILNVSEHSLWKGQTITAIRLDPNSNAPGSEFAVDEIVGEM